MHSLTAHALCCTNAYDVQLLPAQLVLQVRNAALAPLVHHKHYPDGFPAERIVFIVSAL
jgi:hypothetical protein